MLKLIRNGIIHENPVFVQVMSLCPLLAVTTSSINAIVMGFATTLVMIGSCAVISILRKLIPNEIRIAASVVIVSGFVTTVHLLMQAYLPAEINESLGIFIPLIVVNCLLFARIEAFACKNKVLPSIVDAFGMGIGFTLSLFLIGMIREFFGSGAVFGVELISDVKSHMLIMIMAPGAFFTLGGLIMILKHFKSVRKER